MSTYNKEYLEECKNHWYACIYEQQVIEADEIALIRDAVGSTPKRILEVACGGGRILAPLAEAGHVVTGFDTDKAMLERCQKKIQPFRNARCYQADAVTTEWGKDFDVVILAGNILVNIISDLDNTHAQALFIRKASEALKRGGHLYLDFDCPDWQTQSAEEKHEWVCFEGTDDRGTYGKYIVLSGDYSSETRIDSSSRRYEITPNGGTQEVFNTTVVKHFPTLKEVHQWLAGAGLAVEWEYAGFDRRPVNENELGTHPVIWARKE